MSQVVTRGNLAIPVEREQARGAAQKKIRVGIGSREKVFYIVVALLAGLMACLVLFKTVQIVAVNENIQELRREISVLEEANRNLVAAVELGTGVEQITRAALEQQMSIDESRIVVLPQRQAEGDLSAYAWQGVAVSE